MRLSTLSIAAVAAAGLIACGEGPSSPLGPDAAPDLARTANEVMPFGPMEMRSCSGEWVALTGTTHVVALENPSATRPASSVRFTTKGVGVGVQSDASYTFHETFALAVRSNGADTGDDMTDVVTTRLIGQGKTPDTHVSVRYRLRIVGPGKATVETVAVNERCN